MSNELVQSSFSYEVLTPDQAHRTQDAEIRIIGRTQKAIIDNGKDFLAVKADIGHGHFLNWLKSLGISESTAQNWMAVAENFGEIPTGWVFENHAMYLLSTAKVPESAREEAKQRAEEGEKITEEVARQIRDAHKAKEQAEKEAKLAQQQLFNEQSNSKERLDSLNQQLATLKKEMETLSKPEVEIREVDNPDTLAALKKLEGEVRKLTEQRDNLSQLADELNRDLDAQEAKKEQEVRDLRVRQEWNAAADAVHKSVTRFLGQLPMPSDTHVLESDEWARLDDVIQIFRSGIAACDKLRASPSLMIVDAN